MHKVVFGRYSEVIRKGFLYYIGSGRGGGNHGRRNTGGEDVSTNKGENEYRPRGYSVWGLISRESVLN
jgi:hypothetical protein